MLRSYVSKNSSSSTRTRLSLSISSVISLSFFLYYHSRFGNRSTDGSSLATLSRRFLCVTRNEAADLLSILSTYGRLIVVARVFCTFLEDILNDRLASRPHRSESSRPVSRLSFLIYQEISGGSFVTVSFPITFTFAAARNIKKYTIVYRIDWPKMPSDHKSQNTSINHIYCASKPASYRKSLRVILLASRWKSILIIFIRCRFVASHFKLFE